MAAGVSQQEVLYWVEYARAPEFPRPSTVFTEKPQMGKWKGKIITKLVLSLKGSMMFIGPP